MAVAVLAGGRISRSFCGPCYTALPSVVKPLRVCMSICSAGNFVRTFRFGSTATSSLPEEAACSFQPKELHATIISYCPQTDPISDCYLGNMFCASLRKKRILGHQKSSCRYDFKFLMNSQRSFKVMTLAFTLIGSPVSRPTYRLLRSGRPSLFRHSFLICTNRS